MNQYTYIEELTPKHNNSFMEEIDILNFCTAFSVHKNTNYMFWAQAIQFFCYNLLSLGVIVYDTFIQFTFWGHVAAPIIKIESCWAR